MNLLATALQPYATLPGEAVMSVCLLVVIAGAAIIFGVLEIIHRGAWNQRFQNETSLELGHVLRSHARRGRSSARYPNKTAV